MAAGAGGDRAVRLRLDWHISQLYDFNFLLWNVQVEHCHPSIAGVRGTAGEPFLAGEATTEECDEVVEFTSPTCRNIENKLSSSFKQRDMALNHINSH